MKEAIPIAELSISREALTVLRQSRMEEDRVAIPETQLPRPLYEEVNEVLSRLGGKWKGGRTRAHVFPWDPRPLLKGVIDCGMMPPKNPTAFFPTPPDLIAKLFTSSLLEHLPDGARILEPSAGFGVLAEELRRRFAHKQVTIDCCEILPMNRRVLEAKGFHLVAEDFLLYQPAEKYHAIVMNPPFSVEGDILAYITHIRHAWELLEDEGVLIAIAPSGYTFRSDKKSYDFLSLVLKYGHWEKNPRGSFRESGTNVETTTIFLKKDDLSWKLRSHQGCPSWNCWSVIQAAENNDEQHQRRRMHLFRQFDAGDLSPDPTHPATRNAIHTYYNAVVQQERAHNCYLELSDADWKHLEQQLVREWREERGIAEPEANTPVAEQVEKEPVFAVASTHTGNVTLSNRTHTPPATHQTKPHRTKTHRTIQYEFF